MRGTIFIFMGSVSLLALTPVYAADPAPSGQQIAQAAPNQGLEEVTVTAQRRTETLLQVPLAITATSALQLQNQGLKYISDLQFNTPGLLPLNGTGYTELFIRGIGNNLLVGADPSVQTNIDDVPRIYGSMVNSFVNVDRVEVLKGAQGGLYGRNATGGVVNIITKQPSDELAGDVDFSYGTYNTGHAAGYLNVPLTDRIAWNVSFERDWHDPYVKNIEGPNPLTAANFPQGAYGMTPAQTAAFFNSWISPEKGYGNQDFYAGDTKAAIRVSENFKIIVDADFARKRDSDGNAWATTSPGASAAADVGILGAFGINFVPTPGLYVQPGKFETVNSDASSDALRDYGGSIKLLYTLPGFDLENIFAYRAQQTLYEQNYGHPITTDVPIVRNRKDYQYEELRAVSNGDGPFHWLVGASYLNDYIHGDSRNLLFPPLDTISFLASSTNTDTVTTDWVHDYSVYGQASYDITERFTVTGSLRYINETNTTVFLAPVSSVAGEKRDRLLPAGTLSYKLEDGGNVYVRYAEGWKAGGVNPVVPPNFFPTDYGKLFGPEIVDTYEVGFKDSFLDRRAQVTTAIFWNDDTGLQVSTNGNAQHPNLIFALINAGTARTYGWEGSVNYRVLSPLTVGLSVDYLEAEYLSFSNNDCSVLQCFDNSHTRMPWAPKWQGAISVDLDQPLNDRYRLVGSILTSYISNNGGSQGGSDLPSVIPGYSVTNVRLGIHTMDDQYAFTVYAKNLFDRAYAAFNQISTFGKLIGLGDRRTIGAELEYKF